MWLYLSVSHMLGLIIVGKYNTIMPKIKEIWLLEEISSFSSSGSYTYRGWMFHNPIGPCGPHHQYGNL